MPDEWFAHPTAVIDDGARIGRGTKIWHFCHVMGTARIGPQCVLGQNVFVGPKVEPFSVQTALVSFQPSGSVSLTV